MANRHAQQIVEGEVLACRWAKAAAQRQLNDLAKFKGKSSPYEFNPGCSPKPGNRSGARRCWAGSGLFRTRHPNY
jgi:hypothetical protein